MKIELQKAGKKYFREWIFRNANITLDPAEKIAVLGPNGSGKSTFLQILSGAVIPTEGKIIYTLEHIQIDPEMIFRHVSIAAPYLELIEEFTLDEIIAFHFSFKKPIDPLTVKEIIYLTGLEASRKKVFKYFSSGMKQRVKLALAILSDSNLILLDEPCSNLDNEAVKWYKNLVEKYASARMIIVCSNNLDYEFDFCKRHINMMDLKYIKDINAGS